MSLKEKTDLIINMCKDAESLHNTVVSEIALLPYDLGINKMVELHYDMYKQTLSILLKYGVGAVRINGKFVGVLGV